ncbi:MAG: transposase [Deltaproteobacteria bacterium]|nr:transposase [Deltaproteobacteria bacterium]
MVRQEMSISWKKLSCKVGGLNYRIANRRMDVLHKISRALVEGCDGIGIGHWEPERQVSYRKKKKALMKQVKANVEGAKENLKALEQEKSKHGPKGVKKTRRGGRDRSIATLRRMVEEKAKRVGSIVYPDINEAGSTMTCSNCGAKTGPTGKENLSVREWVCKEYQRDLNSAFNILKKTKQEFAAAQAAASSETMGHTATRTMTHGTMVQSDDFVGFHVRGSSGRGGVSFNTALPDLWQEEAPKAFKSLIQMGVARSLAEQEPEKNQHQSPP